MRKKSLRKIELAKMLEILLAEGKAVVLKPNSKESIAFIQEAREAFDDMADFESYQSFLNNCEVTHFYHEKMTSEENEKLNGLLYGASEDELPQYGLPTLAKESFNKVGEHRKVLEE